MSTLSASLESIMGNRRLRSRILLAFATVFLTALAFYFYAAGSTRIANASDASVRNAWHSTSNASPSITPESFLSTWGAKRSSNAEQTTLSWLARDTRDLQQSLLALDATRVVVQRISVTKRDAEFNVVAEITP